MYSILVYSFLQLIFYFLIFVVYLIKTVYQDNWEDEDEEKKDDGKVDGEVKKPKKKSIQERLAEKEVSFISNRLRYFVQIVIHFFYQYKSLQKLKREEKERRLKELEEDVEISPEERLRMQKESDLTLALETTFGETKESPAIDGLSLPNNKEEFDLFTENLTKKLTPLSKNIEYPSFIENLTRNLCATSKFLMLITHVYSASEKLLNDEYF